eukprot:TRINITY_DN75770_c0_g1_i1.p1 TRINITY_DN75770_c0_g1~~TRINITY_DN75770_c0_g1_i1.p1  ORF type:complete len:432 (+),score=61.51 TRINITY_DN75770_c0_g1_i1:46-1341(+)
MPPRPVLTMESANDAQYFVIHSQSSTPSNQAIGKAVAANRQRTTSSLGRAAGTTRRSGRTASTGKKSIGAGRGSSASSSLRVPVAKGATASPPSPPLQQQREVRVAITQAEQDPDAQELISHDTSSAIIPGPSQGHLRQENEELRLKVDALNDEIQWSTENYWQVISSIVAERNKLEEHLEQQRQEARALEERCETMQQELQARASQSVQLSETRLGMHSCSPAQQFCHAPITSTAYTSVRLPTPMPMRLATCSPPVPTQTWTSFCQVSQTAALPAAEFRWPHFASLPYAVAAPKTSCRQVVYLAAPRQSGLGQPTGLLQRVSPIAVRDASVAPRTVIRASTGTSQIIEGTKVDAVRNASVAVRTVIRAPSGNPQVIEGPMAEVASGTEPEDSASNVISLEEKDPTSNDLKIMVSRVATPLRRGRVDDATH